MTLTVKKTKNKVFSALNTTLLFLIISHFLFNSFMCYMYIVLVLLQLKHSLSVMYGLLVQNLNNNAKLKR